MFSGCDDLLGIGSNDDPKTDSLTITGIDSNERPVVVVFSKSPSSLAASVKAATMVLATGDSYKISRADTEVSSGTIAVIGTGPAKITFTNKSGVKVGEGTWGGERDLAFSITGVENFYVPDHTRVKAPEANPQQGDKISVDKKVELTSPDAIIRYTINSPTPPTATSGTVYTGPIQVVYEKGEPFIIKAIAVKDNMVPSAVVPFEYKNQLDKPVARPGPTSGSTGVLEGAQVSFSPPASSPSGVKIKYTWTSNGTTPPDPTYDNDSFPSGVVAGEDVPITIRFEGNNDFKIKARAFAVGYTKSELLDLTYSKMNSGNSSNGVTGMLAAGKGVDKITGTDGTTTIKITADVQMNGDITISKNEKLEISKEGTGTTDVGKLTVPATTTLTVSEKGSLRVTAGGTLKVDGKVIVANGGELWIDNSSPTPTTTAASGSDTVSYGKLAGSGTLTVNGGGTMYVPGLISTTGFDISGVTAEIVVEPSGQLYLTGTVSSSDTTVVYYPWIGTPTSKDKYTNPVGADFVVKSGNIILKSTASPQPTSKKWTRTGTSTTQTADLYMYLNGGEAMVLGPKIFANGNGTASRSSVKIRSMFTVNPSSTLTIGDGTTITSELIVSETSSSSSVDSASGKIINLGGTVKVAKGSKITAENESDVGIVLDSEGKQRLEYSNKTWQNPLTQR